MESARSCFHAAFKRLQVVKESTSSLASSFKEQLQHNDDNSSTFPLKGYRASTNTDSSCSKECDEGMHAFCEVLMFSDDGDDNGANIEATLHYNIAQTYLSTKNYDKAILSFRRSLEQQTSLTACSLLRSKTLHNLGYCSFQIQDYPSAADYFHQTCDTLMQMGMADHYLATRTYNCIGVYFFNLPDPDIESSLTGFQKSLEIYRSNPDSCTTIEMATLLNNFGRVSYQQEHFERAIDYYQQALVLRLQELGDASIDVAATYFNLGNALHRTRDVKPAITCFDAFLRIAETSLGLETREVAFVYKIKAEILEELEGVESALKYYNKALMLTKAALGDNHREMGCILNKAGNLCFRQGMYEEALRHYVWGLDIENAQRIRDDKFLVVTLTNIAQTHKHLGRTELALTFYGEVYAIQMRGEATKRLDIASTLSSIGLMLYHLKYFQQAFDCYTKALSIRRDAYRTDNHRDIAASLNAIGQVLFKQGMFDLSVQCFNQCLEIRRRLLDPNHHDVAMVIYNLASVSLATGDEESAISQYEEALRIERTALGNKHSDIVSTLIRLAHIKQQCGLLDEAIVIFEEAIQLHRLQNEMNGLREAKVFNAIGNCYLQKADVVNMMKAFASASRILISLGCADEPLAIKGYNLYGMARLHPEAAPVA
ncbi:MAG: hypothetical protein SGILL_003122 [Bacillariaceae sp.]